MFLVWILFRSPNARGIPYFLLFNTALSQLVQTQPPTSPAMYSVMPENWGTSITITTSWHAHRHRGQGLLFLLVSRDTGSYFRSDLMSDLHLDPHFLPPSGISKDKRNPGHFHPAKTFLISNFSVALKHQILRHGNGDTRQQFQPPFADTWLEKGAANTRECFFIFFT